jgi:hypothetical protein
MLSYNEREALRDIGQYRSESPFFWRAKSMPKLAARGFVEPHPRDARGWRITDAGRAELAKPK